MGRYTQNFLGTKVDASKLPSQIILFSKALKTELSKDEYLDYENITIIAHSMGGLISCKYLLDAIYHGETLKVDRVLYICTPFLGSVFSDAAVKLRIASSETKDMITGSALLEDLFKGVNKIEDKVSSAYYFGDKDEVIECYIDNIEYDRQVMLKGDHSSVLTTPNLNDNFEHIEKFIFGNKFNTFIENLYAGALNNNKLSYENTFKRKITRDETIRKFQRNHLQDILLNGNEYKSYSSMMEMINNHHFTPHAIYNGKKYYVKIKSNENILDRYWSKISNDDKVPPCFYIGPRGSGKTLMQNIWISNHFKEMEENRIFHVRCDVHKIYHSMRISDTSKSYTNLSIQNYLDMQFLYILLKYRSSKFNNKGPLKRGACSSLMVQIDAILDKNDKDIVKSSKFKNLGDFLDKQSHNIKHNEVNLRSNDRRYSYALELMGNVSSDENVNDILDNYDEVIRSIEDNGHHSILDLFLGPINDQTRSKVIDRIITKAKENENRSSKIKISDMHTTLLEIEEEISTSKKNTTQLWLKISRYIQEILLSKDYKILKLIDGIDNIIIQDTTKDKEFYENKVEEINEIITNGCKKSVYHFIFLRNDSFIAMEDKFKVYESRSVGSHKLKYIKYQHENAGGSLSAIIKKRYEALEKSHPALNNGSLYDSILSFVFKEYKKDFSNKVVNFNNIRAILRHYLFISLHVLFEFYRLEISEFDRDFCKKLIDRMFDEVFFLRSKLYVCTEEMTGESFDYKYKIFPNIFYTHHRSDKWTGLCRLRILQLLGEDSLSKDNIINKLSAIYPTEYIEHKIENILGYNLIESDFDENLKIVTYKTTYKGNYLLDIVRSNLNIIYFMCLDTPLPKKFVNVEDDFSKTSYLGVFLRTGAPKNTGYGNSIVKSVLTFMLFIKNIHDSELATLKKNNLNRKDLEKLVFPLDVEKVELNMKRIYSEIVGNYGQLHSYFKNIGNYEQTDLERYLAEFGWNKKGELHPV